MTQVKKDKKRVIWIVLDGVGAGAAPDANDFGDVGASTLGNLSEAFERKTGRTLNIPQLEKMGIGQIVRMKGIQAQPAGARGRAGRAEELSPGKDTTSGHWEMAGLLVETPFVTFPKGFSDPMIEEWKKETGLQGVLGNCTASGTEIIERLGKQHIETGYPILYTSADSVWQVAAHETHFGLENLYRICKAARKICDRYHIGRVIARPFVGEGPFQRTYNRKDYSFLPPRKTYLDCLKEAGVQVYGVGKIANIFADQGITENFDTHGNDHGMSVLLEKLREKSEGLFYCNLIDFDMLYGHRRDVLGFGNALESFDKSLEELRSHVMTSGDLLVLTADHGNDPTFVGTDHTREYAPILCDDVEWKPGTVSLGVRKSYGDIGATIADALLLNSHPEALKGFREKFQPCGDSFLNLLE